MLQDQLIELCRQNNRKAQLKLYKQYCDGMYYVAFRYLKNQYDAEDAMQEAFIKAFSKIHQFNAEVSFGAWLKKIVINKCIDFLKSKKLDLVAMNEQVLKAVDDNEQDWMVEEGVSLDFIKEKIELLPEKYRYPVMLYLCEGYDHQEISEILGITEVASRTLLYRGKSKLQEQLKMIKNGTGY